MQINVKKVFTNATDLSAMLKLSQAELENLQNDLFQFTVIRINRLAPADLNKELFDKVYPESKVKTLKEFKNRIKTRGRKIF